MFTNELQGFHQLMVFLLIPSSGNFVAHLTGLDLSFYPQMNAPALLYLCAHYSLEFLTFNFLFFSFLKSPYFRSIFPVPPVSTHTNLPGLRHDCAKILDISSCKEPWGWPGLAAVMGMRYGFFRLESVVPGAQCVQSDCSQ